MANSKLLLLIYFLFLSFSTLGIPQTLQKLSNFTGYSAQL